VPVVTSEARYTTVMDFSVAIHHFEQNVLSAVRRRGLQWIGSRQLSFCRHGCRACNGIHRRLSVGTY
jgi:hypothetical protein